MMCSRKLLLVDGESEAASPVLLRMDPFREDPSCVGKLSARPGKGFRCTGGERGSWSPGAGLRCAPGGGVLRVLGGGPPLKG